MPLIPGLGNILWANDGVWYPYRTRAEARDYSKGNTAINPLIYQPSKPILKMDLLSGRFAHFFVVMSMGVEWEQLRRLVEETVESQGYELVDVELKGGG